MKYHYFYQGYPVQKQLKDLDSEILKSALKVVNKVFLNYTKTMAVRIDCRLPEGGNDILGRDEVFACYINRENLMKRFFDSLNSKIQAQGERKKKKRMRVHPNKTRYMWCRERNYSDNDHYHIVLFFNGSRFRWLGHFESRDSLGRMIIEAWASALGMDFKDAEGLVHYPEHATYNLNANDDCFDDDFDKFFFRISYLAKKATKHLGEGRRNFGCSHR